VRGAAFDREGEGGGKEGGGEVGGGVVQKRTRNKKEVVGKHNGKNETPYLLRLSTTTKRGKGKET